MGGLLPRLRAGPGLSGLCRGGEGGPEKLAPGALPAVRVLGGLREEMRQGGAGHRGCWALAGGPSGRLVRRPGQVAGAREGPPQRKPPWVLRVGPSLLEVRPDTGRGRPILTPIHHLFLCKRGRACRVDSPATCPRGAAQDPSLPVSEVITGSCDCLRSGHTWSWGCPPRRDP